MKRMIDAITRYLISNIILMRGGGMEFYAIHLIVTTNNNRVKNLRILKLRENFELNNFI